MSIKTTSIFNYTDLLSFLKDGFQELKERDSKFSQRYVAARLGIQSTGWLADLFSGRRPLPRKHLAKFSSLLELSAREESYFETLVEYSQAKCLEEKNRAYKKLLTFHEISRDLVENDRAEYFDKWYYPVVRELLLIAPFRGDYALLARKLMPAITQSQAKQAIELLERLKMIKKYANGEYRPTVEHVKKNSVFSSVHYYKYVRSQMELGLDAFDHFAKEERDISAITVALSEESFRTVQEDLKALRQKMIQLSENDNKKLWGVLKKDSRRIYQGVFEVFPGTKMKGGK